MARATWSIIIISMIVLLYSALALKSNSDLTELGGKGYVKFDLSAREFDLCAR